MKTDTRPEEDTALGSTIEEAAERIWKAFEAGRPCGPVREMIGVADTEAAYAVQEINTRRWLAQGRQLVGRKIGLTSKAVQAQLGVDQPDFGMLYEDMLIENGGTVSLRSVMQPKAEAEIAFILSGSLSRAAHTVDDVIAATRHLAPAIEIVGSRIQNWDINIVDTVADNASSGMFVLGSARKPLASVDIVGCKMSMTRNGEVVSSGSGAACLGSPLNAVIWLADTMSAVGRPLQAGDIVMSGALGPMAKVDAGDKFEASIDGLGKVSIGFTA